MRKQQTSEKSQMRKERKDINLNNDGAMYIERRDYTNAIELLSRAFKWCRIRSSFEHIVYDEKNHGILEPNDECHLDSWMSHNKRFPLHPCTNNVTTTTATINNDTIDGDSEFDNHENNKNKNNRRNNEVYFEGSSSSSSSTDGCISRQTIRIPKVVTVYQSEIMVPVAITFNLALAHHLYAIEKDNDEVMLQKAARLYELVFDFHDYTDPMLSRSTIFVMASFNNLGHVYRSLHDETLSECYFRKLLSILMCLVDCCSLDDNLYDLDDFFQSTMHLILPSCTAVAAAA